MQHCKITIQEARRPMQKITYNFTATDGESFYYVFKRSFFTFYYRVSVNILKIFFRTFYINCLIKIFYD